MGIDNEADLTTEFAPPLSVEEIGEHRFTLDEYAALKPEMIETLPLDALLALEAKMIKRLNMLGHEMSPTAELVDRSQKRWGSMSPEQQHRQVFNHIRMGAMPLFAEAIQRREKVQQEQVAEHRHQLGRQRLTERADTWRAAGITAETLNPVQAHQIDNMHTRQKEGAVEGQELYEYTKVTEPVVADWLARMDTLGTQVTYSPSAERDDYRNGVDFYARIPIQDQQGVQREVLLGIDYTLATREDVLEDKLRRNFHRPNREVMHSTIGDPEHHHPAIRRHERFNAVVLALDHAYVDELTEDLNFIEAHDRVDDGNVRALLREYSVDPVMQYLIPLAVHEQLATQLQELEIQQASYTGDRRILEQSIQDHHALMEHFDKILQQRKTLRFDAEEMLQDRYRYRTFRVADRRWHHDIKMKDGHRASVESD